MSREPANKGKTYPAEVLTPDEVRAILAQCPATWMGVRDRAFITTLYRAGLRLSECLDLYPKDVDVAIGSVTVLRGKGGRRRTVGIDPGACEVIRSWLERRAAYGFADGHHLYCTTSGRRLTPSYVRIALIRYARQAGVAKRVHPHGFRHTHAYELLTEGVNISIIQRQLGHVSLATTDTYLNHIAPVQVIEEINKRDWSP